MSIPANFQKLAIEVAKEIQGRMTSSQNELHAMQTRMAQIQMELDAAKLASQRSLNFQFKIGSDYQCPKCWVANGINSAITPIPGNDREDLFRCHTCHFETSIPA